MEPGGHAWFTADALSWLGLGVLPSGESEGAAPAGRWPGPPIEDKRLRDFALEEVLPARSGGWRVSGGPVHARKIE